MRFILFVVFLSIITGCNTLQQTHTSNVKVFAKAAKDISTAPGDLYHSISNFRHDLKMVEISTLFSEDLVITQLNDALIRKIQFEKNANQINEACVLIESYSECLLALTDNGYQKNLGKQSNDFALRMTTALSTYNKYSNKKIPSSIGSFLSVVVTKVGSIKLRQLQKKYLKEFVESGSLIINDVCNYFSEDVSASLNLELGSLKNQFEELMKTFYNSVKDYQKKQNVNPYDYLTQYNPLYISLKQKLISLDSLKNRTIEAMGQIKSTHEILKTSVNIHMPDELLAEVKELYATTLSLKKAFTSLMRSEKK
jgi:hypothetical protein